MESTDDHQQRLMYAFDFDDWDLEMNRTRRINGAQLNRLKVACVPWRRRWFYSLLVLAIFCVLVSSGMLKLDLSPNQSGWLVFAAGLVIVMVVILFTVLYGAYVFDKKWPQVLEVEGTVALNEPNSQGGRRAYSIFINGMRFGLDSDRLWLFDFGETYAVYYLRYSKTILSIKYLSPAKPIPPAPAPRRGIKVSQLVVRPHELPVEVRALAAKPAALTPQEEEFQRLTHAFLFKQDDLDVNRAGQLSARQLKLLEDDLFMIKVEVVILVLAIVGLALALSFVKAEDGLVLAASAAFLLGIMGVVRLGRYGDLRADLKAATLYSAEGQADLEARTSSRVPTYFLYIDQLTFRLQPEEFAGLRSGETYRVYYLRQSMKILSAEWLRGDDNRLDEAN